MAKQQIESMVIIPGKDGSHSVRHHFRRVVSKKSTAPMGIGYDSREPDEHSFGLGSAEHSRMLAHIGKHLGLKVGKGEIAEEAQESKEERGEGEE
jgi:hypothetical protein